MRTATRATAVVVIVAILMAGAVELQAVREERFPSGAEDEATLYLRSGSLLQRLTVALNALAADVYWIRAIQYYGGTKRRLDAAFDPPPPPMLAAPTAHEYDLLYPLLDITTTLDPRFNIAYRFGAVFLGEPFPHGPGRPDLAVALLLKGVRARPEKWEYLQDIGFVHYWYIQDYRTAAEWFRKASEVPGAPWWLRSLAATTLAQGGDRQSSRTMWQAIQQSAEIDWLKTDAARRLQQLDALDAIDQLQSIVDMFTKRFGAPPPDWNAVVRAGLLRGIPPDPAGTPFEIVDGRVGLSRRSKLFPLPAEPKHLPEPPRTSP